ncbi:hypothetical protein PpSQ1_00345 [Pseudomonas putida]|nr:hypothetical protein PpSQ1_00345 [Pseudomonas putida]
MEQAFQDDLLAKRLPKWVLKLGQGDVDPLFAALKSSLVCRQQLSAQLQRIEGIGDFVSAALQEGLDTRFGSGFDVSTLYFRQGYLVPSGEQIYTGRVPVMVPEYVQIPLLEAALNNFVADEAENQLPGNGLVTKAGEYLRRPTASEFARLCRQLDLGARYQRQLDAVLLSTSDQAGAGSSVRSLLLELQRCTLLVDAYRARAEGVLSEGELQLVSELCRTGQLQELAGARVVAKQLRVLDCDLEQIIVFDVLDEGWVRTTSKRVLVYIPGDPHGPWSAFPDCEQFARKVLGKRLRDSGYLKFFSRFVRRRDSQRFFSKVIELYHEVAIWASRDLDEHLHAYPQPLFDHLATARILQIKDDAAMIVPPVAQIDRAVQRDHERRLAAEGWALIGLAGLFVPAIGAVLLATMVWQMLAEVFHGIEEWREGDTAAALDHLTHVAMDLAVAAATVAGITLVKSAWVRSALVDKMVSAPLEQGGEKLWNQDPRAFRSAAPQAAPDAQGIRRAGGQAWIEMEGHHYPARQRVSDGQWQLMPRAGFGPLLLTNGGGAWRLASDQPSRWTDVHSMFRRLGGMYGTLDDATIDAVLSIHGLGAENLRALHMAGQLPDPWLADTVQRVSLDRRVQALIEQLRAGEPVRERSLLEHARRLPGTVGLSGANLAEQVQLQRRQLLQGFYDSVQPSDNQAVSLLRSLFPALHHRAAQALVDAADADEFKRLISDRRVSMSLGESARASVARVRRIRVLEALRFDMPQSVDLGCVAIGLLADLPSASLAVRWQLTDGSLTGPVLAEGREGVSDFTLIHFNGRFLRVDEHQVAQGELGELFEVMASAYSASQRAEMGLAPGGAGLQRLLAGLAEGRHDEVERLIAPARVGSFNPPRRLEDGRFGYLLSGRWFSRVRRQGRPQALSDRVHRLFPDMDQGQIDAWVGDVRASGQRVEPLLERLCDQLLTLERHLRGWVAEVPVEARDQRRQFSQALIESWQRSTCEEYRQLPEPINLWWSQMGGRTDELPDLPEQIRLRAIAVLSLRQLGISVIPDGFLRAFDNLRVLELPGNALTRLPMRLQSMPRLQCLDLSQNRITLDPGQSAILAGCEQLRYLNLSNNPLGRSFSVAAMSHLIELRLNDTQIDRVPYGLMACTRLHALDVRNNRITELPAGFFRARLWIEGQVWLHGNLFSAEQARALQAALASTRPGELPHGIDVFPRMRWLDTIDPAERDNLGATWALVESHDGSEAFFELLNGLTQTADFRTPAGASNLAVRVLDMLQVMADDAGLRTELFINARDVTCQDSVALRFSDLEVRVQVWEAQQEAQAGNQEQALLRLGRRLWRLDAVDRIALEDCLARRAAGGDPDEVEVVLAYRLALRRDLDLPVRITTMRFQYLAEVGTARAEQASRRVLAAESTEQVACSLVERDFWQQYLRHTNQALFDQLDEPYRTQIEALLGDHDEQEGVRVTQVAQLHAQRTQAEREAMLRITRDALDLVH